MSIQRSWPGVAALLVCFTTSAAWACQRAGSSVPYRRPTAVNYSRPMYPPPPTVYRNNFYNPFGYNPAAAYMNYLNQSTPPYATGLINYSSDNCTASRQQLFVRNQGSTPPAGPPAAPPVESSLLRPAPTPPEPAVRLYQIHLNVDGVRNTSDAEYLEHHVGKVAGVKLIVVKRNKADGTTTMKVWYAEKDPVGPETLISATAKLGFKAEAAENDVAAGGG